MSLVLGLFPSLVSGTRYWGHSISTVAFGPFKSPVLLWERDLVCFVFLRKFYKGILPQYEAQTLNY